jgi:membrane AbrB-like protein
MKGHLALLKTAAVAALGAAVFLLLNLPLPFLMGPMFFCLISALFGMKLESPGQLGMAFRTILGVAIGASITPDVLASVPRMAPSLAILPLYLMVLAACSYPLMRRVFKLDKVTSYYSAMPGGLQDLLIFGEEAGANVRALSLVHATRVLCLVTFAPILMNAIWHVDLVGPPGRPAADTPIMQIILLAGAGLAGWQIAARIGMFGASILGPMILTAALSLSGIITQRPPAEMIWASQFFIGLAVGRRYVGLTLREFRSYVLAGILNSGVLACLGTIFILLVVFLGLAPELDAYLAYLPGGQSEMVVLAIIAGADLTYVVLHHVLRIAIVVTCSPIIMAWLKHRKDKS